MSKRKQDRAKLDEALGLSDLGVIDEREFARRWDAAGGVTVEGGSIEDAPDDFLIAAFNARGANEGQKAYLASLLVGRGLTACGCKHCQKVEEYAGRWDASIRQREG